MNKSGMFELYDRERYQLRSDSIYRDVDPNRATRSFIGVPAYDPADRLRVRRVALDRGNLSAGHGGVQHSLELHVEYHPGVERAISGPTGARPVTKPRVRRSRSRTASCTSATIPTTPSSRSTQRPATRLWTLSLPSWGNVGTVIANGMVYVGAGDGTITAFAPAPSASKKRKNAVRSTPIPFDGWTPFTPWGRPPTNVPAARELERLR